ncbi:MAG: hypothetical protein NVS4B12_18090 [Ktedonobacteraceae bacterium]
MTVYKPRNISNGGNNVTCGKNEGVAHADTNADAEKASIGCVLGLYTFTEYTSAA